MYRCKGKPLNTKTLDCMTEGTGLNYRAGMHEKSGRWEITDESTVAECVQKLNPTTQLNIHEENTTQSLNWSIRN